MTGAPLLTEFAAHRPNSIRAAYQIYGRLVYSVCYKVLGGASLAETATQQTFLDASRAPDILAAGSSLGPWLCRTAHRIASDLCRQQRRHRGNEQIDIAESGRLDDCTSSDRPAEAWKMRQALDRLPVEDQELIRLQHHRKLSHIEIAQRLDLPIAAVKLRSHRAHHQLIELLQDLDASWAEHPVDENPARRSTRAHPSPGVGW